jgi:hypothetical protein
MVTKPTNSTPVYCCVLLEGRNQNKVHWKSANMQFVVAAGKKGADQRQTGRKG